MAAFLPYGRQTISIADIAAVINVLRSPYLTQGPVVPAFEQAVANQVNASHGVAVNSATSALHIACLALGLSPGDRLWTSPITFVASANCGRYCGAEVEFVDINASTGLMDTNALRLRLEEAKKENRLPKVVIPVHLAGSSCDMIKIHELSRKYGFKIIEDASHAIGGEYEGERIGNCQYSDITVFSFHPVKIVTTGEGGMAVTQCGRLAERMRGLRSHGITKDTKKFRQKDVGQWHYEQHELGFNYRMTDISASLGLSQLKRLDKIIRTRNDQLDNYKRLLKDTEITILDVPGNCRTAGHLAVALLGSADRIRHKRIFSEMREHGIGVQLHYIPVHLQPYYRNLGFKEGDFYNAESYALRALSLPIYPGLKHKDQIRVSRTLEILTSKYKSSE